MIVTKEDMVVSSIMVPDTNPADTLDIVVELPPIDGQWNVIGHLGYPHILVSDRPVTQKDDIPVCPEIIR